MVNIIDDIFRRKKGKESLLKKAFTKIKKELDDYRSAINENTNEIQVNYEYLCEIDAKIEKLNEKMDEIAMFVGLTKPLNTSFQSNASLTRKEKEVFMALYLLGEEKGFVSYKNLARRLGFSEDLVMNYVMALIEKGIPVLKKYVNNEPFIKIEDNFRALQAKKNIINLNAPDLF